MASVIAHPGGALYHGPNPWQRPQIRAEAMRLRTLPQCLLYLPQLSTVQLRLAPRTASPA